MKMKLQRGIVFGATTHRQRFVLSQIRYYVIHLGPLRVEFHGRELPAPGSRGWCEKRGLEWPTV